MKFDVKNRLGLNVVCEFKENPLKKGLVFVMHGLGGFKEQKHVRTFANAFFDSGFSVVLFDCTNSFGQSEGEYENATLTNYFNDLEDVISYCKTQDWFITPFYLVGHSLGGISTILYTLKNSNDVKGLAPISTVVSGKLVLETGFEGDIENWEKTGILVRESETIPSRTYSLKWNHVVDRLKYDVLFDANKIKCPVLMIVGENDVPTPVNHQKMFYDELVCDKEFHIIKEAPHTFREKEHLDEIYEIFKDWIKKVE